MEADVPCATPRESAPQKPRRHWFQYSLRSLLLLTLVVSLGMAWLSGRMRKAKRQEEAVAAITALGGWVYYDYQLDASDRIVMSTEPPGPAWLRRFLGDDFFTDVVQITLDHDAVADADAALAHLQGLSRLRILRGRRVTDAGLKYLQGLTQLQWLDIGGTKITDAGLEHLKGLTQLQSLMLQNTQVTDTGVQVFQRVLPKCIIVHRDPP